MAKKTKKALDRGAAAKLHLLLTALAAVVFFLMVCLLINDTLKQTLMVLLIGTLLSGLLFFSRLRGRLSPVLLVLALVVVMDGLSCIYAPSGKFALYESSKVLASFCMTICLLAFAPAGKGEAGRWIASVLAGFSALSGLVSIDMISTRVLSGAVEGLLSLFGGGFATPFGVEPGLRIISLYGNPNAFAGTAGLGTLLSLGLSLSAETSRKRCCNLVCLYLSALSFLLAFSMGASGIIAAAFLVYLAMERRERRPALFVLMLETLILCAIAAGVISVTSFSVWTEPRVTPLLCTALGAAALCACDRFAGRALTGWLDRHTRATFVAAAAVVALLIAFGVTAFQLTGPADMAAQQTLRRAAYPAPGEYVLTLEAEGGPVSVAIQSQNQQEAMMHTSTILYQGLSDEARFTVPDDSMVVYFNFFSQEPVRYEKAEYQGPESGSLPLGYKLLPGFIANRLQGIFANQNVIQRFVFFSDGMKLFRRSPVFGLGIGAFENAIKGVQTFYYETKYAHNHYIQALVETGMVGLVLFVGLLAFSGATVWRCRKCGGAPVLGAALVFMAGHAAVEVVFSSYNYLPIAYGVFALIGLLGLEALPQPKWLKAAQLWSCGVLAAGAAVFAVLLSNNMRAAAMIKEMPSYDNLVRCAELDKFEWADYKLSYLLGVMSNGADSERLHQADLYAEELSHVNSNTLTFHLSEYYLYTDRVPRAMEMAQKYAAYTASDLQTWNKLFEMLETHEMDDPDFRQGVVQLADMLNQWNRENMGRVQVSEQARAFVSRMGGAIE